MADNAIIKNNVFVGNYGAVSIQNAIKWQITDNRISEGFLGIFIVGQGGVISGNEITQTVHQGIRIDAGMQGLAITDNTLHDMWGSGMVLHSRNSDVKNNTFYDIKGKAIATALNGNTSSGNSFKDIWVATDANRVNNWITILLPGGIVILAILVLLLFKNSKRHIIRS